MLRWIIGILWRIIFFWKKRTGWIDLGREIEVTGTVAKLESNSDGDRSIALRLDEGQEQWITGFGGRLTTGDRSVGPSLHCEVVPWSDDSLRTVHGSLRIGDRVRVRGAWGFDGVHLGVWFPFEVLLALVRHGPNVHEGWFEIHPVTSLEVI